MERAFTEEEKQQIMTTVWMMQKTEDMMHWRYFLGLMSMFCFGLGPAFGGVILLAVGTLLITWKRSQDNFNVESLTFLTEAGIHLPEKKMSATQVFEIVHSQLFVRPEKGSLSAPTDVGGELSDPPQE